MGVASYFEFVTTLLAWVLYHKAWSVLLDSALVFVPFITMIAGNIISSRKAGDDEGSAAIQSLKKIETDLYIMIGVLVFAAIPVVDVQLGEMTYVKPPLNCAVAEETVPGTATGTTYDAILTTLGGETGKAPIWWAGLHTLSKSVVSASIAGLPCANDVGSVAYKLAGDKIDSPDLRKELGEFTRDCYKASKAKLLRMDTSSLTRAQRNDTLWIGSNYFQLSPGFYSTYYSYDARANFPFAAGRDSGFEDDFSAGGHPTCNEWWSHASNGLRIRLLDSIDADLLDEQVHGTDNLMSRILTTPLSTTDRENVFLRKYLDLQETSLGLAGSSVSAGYQVSNVEAALARNEQSGGGIIGGLVSGTSAFFSDVAITGTAAVGAAFQAPKAITEGYAIRNGISMIQAIVLMMLVIMLPFLMLFSQYKMSMVFNLSIIFFSLHLLSYVWAIAFWIENNLLTAMLGAGGLSVYQPGQNLTQSTLMWFMERFLYVILPMIVLTSLGWVGIKVGDLGNQLKTFGGNVGSVGGAGAAAVKTVATKGKG